MVRIVFKVNHSGRKLAQYISMSTMILMYSHTPYPGETWLILRLAYELFDLLRPKGMVNVSMKGLESAMDVDAKGILVNCANCGKRNRMSFNRLGQTFRCGECHTELPAPAEAIEIKDKQGFEAIISESALPVLVDFWAPWCGPCKMVAPEMDKVAAQGSGRWLVVKVNTEELQILAQQFEVNAIPLMVVFKGGRELARQAGAMPAQGIRSLIQKAF